MQSLIWQYIVLLLMPISPNIYHHWYVHSGLSEDLLSCHLHLFGFLSLAHQKNSWFLDPLRNSFLFLCMEDRRSSVISSSYKKTKGTMWAPIYDCMWNYYYQKFPPPNTITFVVKTSTYEFGASGGAHKHFIHNTYWRNLNNYFK